MKKLFIKAFSKQKSKSGFSLVEVLLAVVLLAIIVTPLMQVIISSMNVNQKSRELMAATNFAETMMEYFESVPLGDGTDGLLKDQLDNPGASLNLPCFPGLITAYDLNRTVSGGSSNYTDGGYAPYEGFQQTCVLVSYTRLGAGIDDGDYCYYYSTPDGVDWYAIHGYRYDGYKLDAYITLEPLAQTETDDYVVYDITISVYGHDKNAVFADHSINRPLVTIHGSTFDSFDTD